MHRLTTSNQIDGTIAQYFSASSLVTISPSICPSLSFGSLLFLFDGTVRKCSSEHIRTVIFLNCSEGLKKERDGLAPAITHNADKPMRDIALVDVEVTEIENALGEFKREVASGASSGTFPSRLVKE